MIDKERPRESRKESCGSYQIGVVVVVGELVEEGARFQDEGGQDDFGQVHSGAHLFDEEPDEALVVLGQLLRQLARLLHTRTLS